MKFFLVVLVSVVSASAPIPKKTPGFQIGAINSQSRFELFIDLHCSACQEFFPIFLAALDSEIKGKKLKELLDVTLHVFPLPYHLNSFYASQMAFFIQKKYPERYVDYLRLQLQKEGKYNSSTDVSANVVQSWLQEDAKTVIGKDDPEIKIVFERDEFNIECRVAWKYAITRGVLGTPTAFINGVAVSNLPFKVEELAALLGKYVPNSTGDKKEATAF